MGLIARVTSNGKDTNCTRLLLTLPVLVMSAYIARVAILLIVNRL